MEIDEMPLYYKILDNAVTDALRALAAGRPEEAEDILSDGRDMAKASYLHGLHSHIPQNDDEEELLRQFGFDAERGVLTAEDERLRRRVELEMVESIDYWERKRNHWL